MGKKHSLWWIAGGTMLVVGLVSAIQIVSTRPSTRGVSAFKYDSQVGPRRKVKGPDSAPVKVVEFGDFQ